MKRVNLTVRVGDVKDVDKYVEVKFEAAELDKLLTGAGADAVVAVARVYIEATEGN